MEILRIYSYDVIGTALLNRRRPSQRSCPRFKETLAKHFALAKLEGIRGNYILYWLLQEYSESAEKSISPLFQERYPCVTSKFLNLDKSKNAFVIGFEAPYKKDLKSTVLLSPSEKNNSTE